VEKNTYFAYPAAGTLLHLDPPQTTSWNSIVSGVKWWVFMPGKPGCICVEVENKMEKLNYFLKRNFGDGSILVRSKYLQHDTPTTIKIKVWGLISISLHQ
jgi:hypothetical protein